MSAGAMLQAKKHYQLPSGPKERNHEVNLVVTQTRWVGPCCPGRTPGEQYGGIESVFV